MNIKQPFFPRLFLIILLSLGITTPAFSATAASIFQDFDANSKALSDYTGQGQWTIVMFWASDCHVCNQEAKSYVAFHEARKNKDAQILGISMDGQEKKSDALQFIKRHAVTFPNLLVEAQDGADFYTQQTGESWVGTPTFMIYKPDGTLAAAQVGAVPVKLIEDYIAKNSP